MPLDPSIIMSAKPVEVQNPMDAMGKLMTMQSLANQNQLHSIEMKQHNQTFNDDQAMKQAYQNNTTVGPDGKISFNKDGMLKSLANTNAYLVPKAEMALAQNNAEKMKILKEQAEYAGQKVDGVTDQKSWDSYKEHLRSIGYPVEQLPNELDKNILPHIKMQAMNAKDQYSTQIAQQEADNKKQHLGIEQQKLGMDITKNQAEQVQQTLTSLQSARGNPAVQTAERDIYSNAKVNKLVNQGVDKNGRFDPNKLNNTQVQLLAGEVGKIATGGAPTLDELRGLTPNNTPQWLAKAAEQYRNTPTAANAGAFVKQLQNYSNGVAEDAKALLKENYQGIIESKKDYLPAKAYQTLNDQFLGRLDGNAPAGEWSLSQKPKSEGPSSEKKTTSEAPPPGTSKEWNGKTYVVKGGHWVLQTPTQVGSR